MNTKEAKREQIWAMHEAGMQIAKVLMEKRKAAGTYKDKLDLVRRHRELCKRLSEMRKAWIAI